MKLGQASRQRYLTGGLFLLAALLRLAGLDFGLSLGQFWNPAELLPFVPVSEISQIGQFPPVGIFNLFQRLLDLVGYASLKLFYGQSFALPLNIFEANYPVLRLYIGRFAAVSLSLALIWLLRRITLRLMNQRPVPAGVVMFLAGISAELIWTGHFALPANLDLFCLYLVFFRLLRPAGASPQGQYLPDLGLAMLLGVTLSDGCCLGLGLIAYFGLVVQPWRDPNPDWKGRLTSLLALLASALIFGINQSLPAVLKVGITLPHTSLLPLLADIWIRYAASWTSRQELLSLLAPEILICAALGLPSLMRRWQAILGQAALTRGTFWLILLGLKLWQTPAQPGRWVYLTPFICLLLVMVWADLPGLKRFLARPALTLAGQILLGLALLIPLLSQSLFLLGQIRGDRTRLSASHWLAHNIPRRQTLATFAQDFWAAPLEKNNYRVVDLANLPPAEISSQRLATEQASFLILSNLAFSRETAERLRALLNDQHLALLRLFEQKPTNPLFLLNPTIAILARSPSAILTRRDHDRYFQPIRGHAYRFELGNDWSQFDDQHQAAGKVAILYENGRPLGPRCAMHADIIAKGAGRYSHWSKGILFATPDNSNPNENGRDYRVRLIEFPTIPKACFDADNPN
jgi:hypothetical protein